jgi:hypothetical protein
MTRFLVIKNFLSLKKTLKKRPTTKQNLNKRKAKRQNLSSLNLFTFVVLLFVDVGVVVITILLFCSRKQLLSYVLM